MPSSYTLGLLVCVSAFLYQAMVGSLYIWGAISIYVASYYRQYYPEITPRELSTFMPVHAIILMTLLPLGSFLEKAYGPRLIVLVGAVGMTLGVFSLAFVTSAVAFVLMFAFTFGVPTIAFYLPMMCAWRYFPDKKELLTGISVCGYSLGPLVFGYLSQLIVNPNNIAPKEYTYGEIKDHYFDKEVYQNVPKLFIILSIIWGIILAYVTIVVQYPPSEYNPALTSSQKNNEVKDDIKNIQECPDVLTAFKHRTFWILLTLLTVATWSDYTFGLTYKELGFAYKYSDSYLTFVGVLYSLSNTFGRLFWGFMSQKFSFKSLYTIILAGQALFALTLITVAWSPIMYPAWIMLVTFFTSGNFVVLAPLTAKVYGDNMGGRVNSFVATGLAFGTFAMYFANAYILPHIGYKNMLRMVGLTSASCYLLLYIIDLNPEWLKKKGEKADIAMLDIRYERSKEEKLL